MRCSMLRTLGILLLALFLSGCTTTEQVAEALVKSGQRLAIIEEGLKVMFPPQLPMPARPLYVLEASHNALAIVDTETWQVARRTYLSEGYVRGFSRDPQGRIWIGIEPGKFFRSRIHIFAPDGQLLHTLYTCFSLMNDIHFAAGRAFIACEKPIQPGVNVIDLESLEIVKQIDIPLQENFYSLITNGGDENYFVLIQSGETSLRAIFLDTHTFAILDPLSIPASNPQTILAYQGRFLLLNSGAESAIREKLSEPLPEERPDLLIIDTAPIPAVTIQQMEAPGAVYGVIQSDTLVSYHNSQYYGFNPDPFRAVSRLNLVTNQTELWPLPDSWNARDIAIIDEVILLAHSIGSEPESAGLYRFDPATGELTMLVNIPGANRIIIPAE